MPDLTAEAIWLRMSWTRLLSPDTLIGALVMLLIFGLAGLLVTRLLTRAIALVLERDRDKRIDRMVATFLEQFARAFVWVIVLMLYAHTIPALDRLATALLASVSIASVVIGLAAQSTLANFVSGVSLLFYRPFRIGDRLQVNAPGGVETAVVESVSLGYALATSVKYDLTEEIKKRFDTEGIEIPYPYQNVVILEKPATPCKNPELDSSVPHDGPT